MDTSIPQNVIQCAFDFDAISEHPFENPIPRIGQIIPQKQCSICKSFKTVDNFNKDKGCRDGFCAICRICDNDRQRQRYEDKCAKNPPKYRWHHNAVRHNYFSSLDRPIKAYVLGLLASDGNVLPKYNRISWQLSKKDACLAELLRDELAPEHQLRYAVAPNSFSTLPRVIFSFSSQQMVNDLANYGIGAAKTFTLRWPANLPDTLAHAFLLGVFDGDGSMTTNRHQNRWYPRWQLVSASKEFLEDVTSVVDRLIGLKMSPPLMKSDSKTTYALRIGGKGAHILDEWMHQDNLGLERKRISALAVNVK